MESRRKVMMRSPWPGFSHRRAADRGAPIDRIMDHTGHQSAAMVRTYTRRTDAFAQHAGEGLL